MLCVVLEICAAKGFITTCLEPWSNDVPLERQGQMKNPFHSPLGVAVLSMFVTRICASKSEVWRIVSKVHLSLTSEWVEYIPIYSSWRSDSYIRQHTKPSWTQVIYKYGIFYDFSFHLAIIVLNTAILWVWAVGANLQVSTIEKMHHFENFLSSVGDIRRGIYSNLGAEPMTCCKLIEPLRTKGRLNILGSFSCIPNSVLPHISPITSIYFQFTKDHQNVMTWYCLKPLYKM